MKSIGKKVCVAVATSFILSGLSLVGVPAHAATAPTSVTFSTPPQNIPLGKCAVVGVVTQNAGKTANVAAPTTVIIDQGAGKIGFYSDSACVIQSKNLVIPAGQASGVFFISGLATGTYPIRVSTPGLNANTQNETIAAAPPPPPSGTPNPPTGTPTPPLSTIPPSKLEFATAAQTLPQGVCSTVSVVTENSLPQPAAVTKSTTVTIGQGSGKIGYYSNPSCTVKTTNFTIPAGQDMGQFYIAGTAEGSFVISLSASGLNAQTQTETITAPPPPTCSGNQAPPTTPPSQAAAAGFNTLIFDDEFNSTDTISPNNAGTYNWYTYNFYGASAELPSSGYEVKDGCLTILTDLSGYSADLVTVNSSTSTTGTFQHGYFEARMQFNPNGSQGGAWPAFWSYAIEAWQGASPYAELDFLEAYPTGNKVTLLTTVHQWTSSNGSSSSVQQPNDVPTLPAGFNYDDFHIYGLLWTTDSTTWYIDNQAVMTVATGPGTNFTALEQDHMFLALGTGKNWPATYDYVRVWH